MVSLKFAVYALWSQFIQSYTDIANVLGSYAEYRFVTCRSILHVYNYWVDTLAAINLGSWQPTQQIVSVNRVNQQRSGDSVSVDTSDLSDFNVCFWQARVMCK